ncbi:MAG: hypothetical protein EXR98_09000 [Gemmataceae bacterium]|nr:hypothetical protein [Gemmataceae bacterium]
MKSLVLFCAGSVLFGAAALGVGYAIGGTESLLQAGTAFGLTFVPAAITLAWVVWSYRSDPGMMLLASLGASGFRMAIALGGGFYLTQSQPGAFDTPFWFWLAMFYPVFLAFEITLLVRQQPKLNGSPKA